MRTSRMTRSLGGVCGLALLVLATSCGDKGNPSKSGADQAGGEVLPGITEAEIEAKGKALLAALGGPASPEQRAQLEGAFEAVGVEPDWTLTLTSDFVSFQRPGLDEVTAISPRKDIRAGGVFMIAGPLTIAVKTAECTYGASGNFPYTASILFEGVIYEGCARPGSGQEGGGRGWAEQIHQYLPAIDKCLERVQARPGRVTIAYVNEGGQAVVRLLESDGGREECVLAADGSSVVSVEPLSDRAVFDGERDPLFTRSPSKPPAGYSSEEVQDIEGRSIGWLSRKGRGGSTTPAPAPAAAPQGAEAPVPADVAKE